MGATAAVTLPNAQRSASTKMLAALILAATVCVPLPTCSPARPTNCASPTPTVAWDQVQDADLAGYKLYYRATSTSPWVLLGTIACQWDDFTSSTLAATPALYRFCQGAELDVPMQRFCPLCSSMQSYDFAVKAIDNAGNLSASYSTPVSVCFPPTWAGRGTPWN